ncbi:hypothetical protein BOTBODRAFT_190114 [Botryobasidium botryosum FD-172 SS1]|uniref:Uncharacterized protein n=1 Tax=Botryobasidium botryosum (strain FD-172 SS1) TaxID=930990 RepID=A0A067M5X4_BOTB1|nr:hypothetical protein BOTBODRAFT_190114 [Botryobasidium botryosum FD-172 SS1]
MQPLLTLHHHHPSSLRKMSLPSPSPDAPAPRLTTRRGSLAAGDPFARHAEESAPRGGASRITIVRAPPSAAVEDDSPRARAHVRRSSWGSNHSNSSIGSSNSVAGTRLSFAFSSFTPISKPGRPASPGSSSPPPPRSPGALGRSHRTLSNPSLATSFSRQPKLTPQQVYDLAVTSANAPPHAAAQDPTALEPATFTALPQTIYLPFMNRGEEVDTLLRTPPTSRLFSLLEALFTSPSASNPEQESASIEKGEHPEQIESVPEYLRPDTDPTKWSFATLHAFLLTPREQISDKKWVNLCRTCVKARSEALWERFKAALGVPAELEFDDDDDEDEEQEDYPQVDDDEREHALDMERLTKEFEGQDLTHSPIGVSPSPSGVAPSSRPLSNVLIEPIFSPPSTTASSPVTHFRGLHGAPPSASGGRPSFGAMGGLREGLQEEDEDEAANVEEETAAKPEERPATPPRAQHIHALQIHTARLPSVMHRSSSMSHPSLSSSAVGSSSTGTTAKRAPSFTSTHSFTSSNVPRSVRLGLGPLALSMSRAGSTTGGAAPKSRRGSRRGSLASMGSFEADLEEEEEEESAFHPIQERGPGNPLFPSSFAGLSVGPTLSANNPTLRSPPPPVPSAYPGHGGSRSQHPASAPGAIPRRGRRPGSWAHAFTTMDELDKNEWEYAVTVASSSDGGRL